MKNMNKFDIALCSVIAMLLGYIIYWVIEPDILVNCAVAGFMMFGFNFVLMAIGIYYIATKPRKAFSKLISLLAIPMCLIYFLICVYPVLNYPVAWEVWLWVVTYFGYTCIALLDARTAYKAE